MNKMPKAMLIISTAMEFDQLQVVMTCENCATMWHRLKTIHEQQTIHEHSWTWISGK